MRGGCVEGTGPAAYAFRGRTSRPFDWRRRGEPFMLGAPMNGDTKKRFKLSASELRPLAVGHGACMASDRITVDGERVGYMHRDVPSDEADSGWQFLAGSEDDAYVEDAGNFVMHDVNTIANHDPDILAFLEAPVGAAFERAFPNGPFVPTDD